MLSSSDSGGQLSSACRRVIQVSVSVTIPPSALGIRSGSLHLSQPLNAGIPPGEPLLPWISVQTPLLWLVQTQTGGQTPLSPVEIFSWIPTLSGQLPSQHLHLDVLREVMEASLVTTWGLLKPMLCYLFS